MAPNVDTHKIQRCPMCGQQLRIPTAQSLFQITCPICRHQWATPENIDTSASTPKTPSGVGPNIRNFDLNIDKILDNWDVAHAIRELIANALDESLLSQTAAPTVTKTAPGCWTIRDFGRGLKYQDLIQSENAEKIASPIVIGKFGVGLKDALATLDRNRVMVTLRSRHGDIGLSRVSKHAFEDIVTLHATVSPPSEPHMLGTECNLSGVTDEMMERAKGMFLAFTRSLALEQTRYGGVYPPVGSVGMIYVNGMKVAEEPNFLFSYDITAVNAVIKKALNRERQNLGRSAYSDRVRVILLACSSTEVASRLAANLENHARGQACDELTWLDVQHHAVRILNASKRVLFATPEEIARDPNAIDSAKAQGYTLVPIPNTLAGKIHQSVDTRNEPIVDMQQFRKQEAESFQYTWVQVTNLNGVEQSVWRYKDHIVALIGGLPDNVKDIRISETLREEQMFFHETVGCWDATLGFVVIKRNQLRSLRDFAGVLLHELIHAKYRAVDVSREFELHLTHLAGELAAHLLSRN